MRKVVSGRALHRAPMSVGAQPRSTILPASGHPDRLSADRPDAVDRRPVTGGTRADRTQNSSDGDDSPDRLGSRRPPPSEVIIVRASRLLVVLGSSTLLVGTALPASAHPLAAAPEVPASGTSPFAGCPVGAGPADDPGTLYPNTEVEPFVTVNPTDPDNVIGVFQQDRWSNGGSRGLVASRSTNGGQSWTESYAAFSECSGGDPVYDRSSDPWVTFDAAGNAYQISLSISADAVTSAVLVSKSADQ